MASASLGGLPAGAELRDQLFHVWSNWTGWAASNPDQRHALAQLGVCDEVTHATRAAGHQTMADVADLLARSRADGPLRKTPMRFAVAMMTSLADATTDMMVHDPANARKHCKVGFEALWRVIA